MTLEDFSHLATAAGVVFAAYQLWQTGQQAVTSFEDSFTKEYRELAARLPTKAFLGESLSEEEHQEHFDEFYHYFDLCNEQAFLHMNGRISEATWTYWRDGIRSNLQRPAFRRAWSEIASRAGADFAELRGVYPPEHG